MQERTENSARRSVSEHGIEGSRQPHQIEIPSSICKISLDTFMVDVILDGVRVMSMDRDNSPMGGNMSTTYYLPDGSNYTLPELSNVRKRMLACEILSKLGCDFRIGNPKLDAIDYAAPELLKALREMIAMVRRLCGSDGNTETMAKALYAIAKAEGKNS